MVCLIWSKDALIRLMKVDGTKSLRLKGIIIMCFDLEQPRSEYQCMFYSLNVMISVWLKSRIVAMFKLSFTDL